MTHSITKKIEKGKRRVFFQKEKHEMGEFTISFKSFWLTDLYVLKGNLFENGSSFYVDVPVWVWRLTGYFYFINKNIDGIQAKQIWKSGKYEKLI